MKIFFIAILSIVVSFRAYSQCTPTSPGATACSGTAAVSGGSVTSGQTRYYSSSGTFASYTITEGTLRVCGTLTITSLTVNAGTSSNPSRIVVESGGSLTISNSFTNNNYTTIINRGTLVFNGAISASTNEFYLVTDIASATTTFNASVTLSDGTIVNRGKTVFNSAVTLNGVATLCTEKSLTEFNQVAAWSLTASGNSIDYRGSGTNDAVINYKGTNSIAVGAFGLIAANKMKICRDGSGDNPITNYGNATYSGTGCSSPLPVVFSLLNAKINDHSNAITINWGTTQEYNNERFELERSHDGISFEKVNEIAGAGTKNTPTLYSVVDDNVNTLLPVYYRIKQVDFDGQFDYSPVIVLHGAEGNNSISIYPNPLEEGTTLYARFGENDEGIAKVSLFDLSGKEINSYLMDDVKPGGIYAIEDKELLLPKGSYILQIKTIQSVYNQKLEVK